MKPIKLSEENRDFFEKAHAVTRLIPAGRATSYGAIANYLGAKNGARMVGWAMNAAHKLNDVPAHRVVNRMGLLSGKMHFETPTRMEELLKSEGVKVENDQIQEWNTVFWDPLTELGFD